MVIGKSRLLVVWMPELCKMAALFGWNVGREADGFV